MHVLHVTSHAVITCNITWLAFTPPPSSEEWRGKGRVAELTVSTDEEGPEDDGVKIRSVATTGEDGNMRGDDNAEDGYPGEDTNIEGNGGTLTTESRRSAVAESRVA